MASSHVLRGSCSCHRNRYTLTLPSTDTSQHVQMFLDTSPTSRRIHAAPLVAYLRVPLGWYHSTTHSQYDNETHSSIRRVYYHENSADRREFCGYCGAQLSSWSEHESGNVDSIFLTLESLNDEDLEALEELGLLPPTNVLGLQTKGEKATIPAEDLDLPTEARSASRTWKKGSSWFETIIDRSELGQHVKRQRGVHATNDGKVRIEYDIVEIADSPPGDVSAAGKRKFVGEADPESKMT